jgi:hypothetical protein
MFCNAKAFNQFIASGNASNVADMSRMFANARAFYQAIGNWNTSNVTNVKEMFCLALAFYQSMGWSCGFCRFSSIANFV